MNQTVTELTLQDATNCNINSIGQIYRSSDSSYEYNKPFAQYPNDGYTPYYCWDWWQTYYYPVYYPQMVYEDKGKKAIEIVKALMDSKTIQVKTVRQFVDLLDRLMKIL